MRISSKGAKARILLIEWWPANGVTPQIFTKLKNGNFKMEGYIELHNPILPNNFEFHCFDASAWRFFDSG